MEKGGKVPDREESGGGGRGRKNARKDGAGKGPEHLSKKQTEDTFEHNGLAGGGRRDKTVLFLAKGRRQKKS